VVGPSIAVPYIVNVMGRLLFTARLLLSQLDPLVVSIRILLFVILSETEHFFAGSDVDFV